MTDSQLYELLEEIRGEQHISLNEDDNVVMGYLKDAQYDIDECCGEKINYKVDLKARSLLKNFVLYARYSRLAEFRQLYAGEYAYLQAKYYKPSDV